MKHKNTGRKRAATPSFYAKIRDYRVVVRGGASFAGGVTVYGSDETLALVTVEGFGETVKFIALKNVRAVLIRRYSMTPGYVAAGILLTAAVGLTALALQEAGTLFAVAVLLEVLLAALFLLGLRNCSLRIVTDVNDHLLPGIHRYAPARKVLDFVAVRMRPYLAAADGDSVQENGATECAAGPESAPGAWASGEEAAAESAAEERER
jgi:hypothetical protein